MVLMAEGDGLRLPHAGISNVRRALHLHGNPQQRSNHKYRAKNCGPGQGIGAAMKNLRHAYEVSDEPARQCYFPHRVQGSVNRETIIRFRRPLIGKQVIINTPLRFVAHLGDKEKHFLVVDSLVSVRSNSLSSPSGRRFCKKKRVDWSQDSQSAQRKFITNSLGSVISSIA